MLKDLQGLSIEGITVIFLFLDNRIDSVYNRNMTIKLISKDIATSARFLECRIFISDFYYYNSELL